MTHYRQQIPALCWFNALLIASSGTGEPRWIPLKLMLRWTCDWTRLRDLVRNFTLCSEHRVGLMKIIG